MLALAGVVLQYVWRIQEVFQQLALVQFTTVVSAAAIALFLADSNPTRRLSHLRHRLFTPMVVILGLAVLSVPFSIRVGESYHFVSGNFIKTVILAGIIVASIRDRRDVERLVRLLVLGGAGYVAAAIFFAIPGSGRLGGKGSYDPNDLGLMTVSTIPLCLYLMRRGASVSDRVVGFCAAALLMAGTVLSGSRGGFLALVAVVLYGLFALDVVPFVRRFSVMAVAVVVVSVVAGESYWDRIGTLLSPHEDYNWAGQAESGRIEIWKRGLGYMARRPLLGVGVDQFYVAEGTMAPQALARAGMGVGFKWSAAHNSYVQIGAELGVFGLAAFITMLTIAYRVARDVGRTAATSGDRLLGQAFGALVIGFSVGCVFLSQAYATFLYFAVAVLIGFARVVQREHERGQHAFAPQPVSRSAASRSARLHAAPISRGLGGVRFGRR
jgi:O-antigen ligase